MKNKKLNDDEIECAVKRMLDEAGPDQVRRFLASYDDGDASPAAADDQKAAGNPPAYTTEEKPFLPSAFASGVEKDPSILQAINEIGRLLAAFMQKTVAFEHGIDLDNLGRVLTRKSESDEIAGQREYALHGLYHLFVELAAAARGVGSEAERAFRDLCLTVLRTSGGPKVCVKAFAKPYAENVAKSILERFESAYVELVADISIQNRYTELTEGK